MLSKRAKYAIKTILLLYHQPEGTLLSAKLISEREQIPYKFLESILRELRQHRILKSERGAEGGYKLLKDANQIRVSDILRIVDGPIALIPCVSENFYEKCVECVDEETCKIRRLFAEVREVMLPVLDRSITDLDKY